jgi:hypothetical protein
MNAFAAHSTSQLWQYCSAHTPWRTYEGLDKDITPETPMYACAKPSYRLGICLDTEGALGGNLLTKKFDELTSISVFCIFQQNNV